MKKFLTPGQGSFMIVAIFLAIMVITFLYVPIAFYIMLAGIIAGVYGNRKLIAASIHQVRHSPE
jgi:membrane glycosyltransferase